MAASYIKIVKKIFLLLIFLSANLSVYAQTYPVQVNVFALPPYSNDLSAYYSSTRERLVINLLNRDIQRGDISVRLRVKIEASNGLVLTSKEGIVYPQLFLTPNIPERLSQDALAPYFLPQNLNTQGYFNGKLPNGTLYITITAVEQYTGKVVSAPAMTAIFLTNYKPPLLRQPSNNQVISLQNGMINQLFQWELQNRPAVPLEYEFELRELPDNNLAPQSAFLYSPITHQETLNGTSLFYNSMMYPLEANKTYGWRVRAIAKDGFDELSIFENNGYSEIYIFKVDENCQSPFNVATKVEGRNLKIHWNAPFENNEFVVQYRLKYGQSDKWVEIPTTNDSAKIEYPQKGKVYEIRVGGICTSGNAPVFSQIKEETIPAIDSVAMAKCGMPPDVDLSNQEPLEELKVGDVITAGGGFKLTVTKVDGKFGNGVFAGEGCVFFGWILESKMAVVFDSLQINSDYRQIGGTANAKYDANYPQIADLDDFTDGGRNNTNNGITRTNVTLDFTLPEPPEFAYNAETDEFTVKDSEGNLHVIQAEHDNYGGSIFPVTVKDADGNMYLVEEATNEDGSIKRDENGNPELKNTSLGQQGVPLPNGGFDTKNIISNIAVVTFQNAPTSKYAFDTYLEYYNSVSIIKDNYEHFNNAGKSYDVAWKFLATGSSDKVKATIQVKTTDTNFKPEQVIFSTPQGTRYNAEYKDNTYTLTLTGGALGDVQEIYALYRDGSASYYTLGKLKVITYEPQTPKVVVVQVNNNTINANDLKVALNDIYNPVAVNWTLQTDTLTYSDTENFFEKSSDILHDYNDKMRSLINYYRVQKGQYYDKKACYLFILNDSGDGKNREAQGFMPRGKQFGFIFKKNLSANEINTIISHELGHGQWKLRHTFDRDTYGRTAEATQGSTDNLMDYKNGGHIAKWQWDIISQPAIFDGIFDSDEEGMAFRVPGTDFTCIDDPTALAEIQKYRYVYVPDGRIVDLGSYQATGFFTRKDPNAQGALATVRINGTDETHSYYKEGKISVGYGQVEIGKQLKVVEDKTSQAARIFIDEKAKTITIEQNGQVKSISFEVECSCRKYTQKGKEVIKTLSDAGFSDADLIDKIGLLVSKYEAEKYIDYEKISADVKPLQTTDEESLIIYYNSLKAYYEKHASAKLVTNSNCPDCPKYPVVGDNFWDNAGRNWLYRDEQWIDLSGEFIDNTEWKQGIDVQAIHKQLYEYKFALNRTSPLFSGYTDKALFEKTLWRTTQYLVVRTLKEQWASEQVGNAIWIPLYGSITQAYYLNKVSEGDMMLQTQAGFDAALGVSDIFLVKALATGIFKFTMWTGGKMIGQDIVYLAKKQLITARLSFILSTEAPLEASAFLKKQGDNIIEIINKANNKFIKYDLETGQTLICHYSDNAARTLELGYEDFRTVNIPVGTSEDDIVERLIALGDGGAIIESFAFKVGDEIAGIKIARIKQGSEKVFVIGRSMEDITKFADDLAGKIGTQNVEIFAQGAEGTTNCRFLYQGKSYSKIEFENLIEDLGNGSYPRYTSGSQSGWVVYEEVLNTKLGKLNAEVIQEKIQQGYTILDLGIQKI
jgi:hypothetical protein